MKVANYRDNEGGQLYGHGRFTPIGIMNGGQLYGYGRWPTKRKWKVANYTDMEGRWPTMRIWKVANYRDMEGGQL